VVPTATPKPGTLEGAVALTFEAGADRGYAEDIVARCMKLAAPGAVYVFHVGRASQDGIALKSIIAGLREKGFGFARVDDL
jgi:hypothetical protein